jgi:hypothetical protein
MMRASVTKEGTHRRGGLMRCRRRRAGGQNGSPGRLGLGGSVASPARLATRDDDQ